MNPVIEEISRIGIVPVIALDDAKDAEPLAKALCEGGLPCAEVTFRTAAAEDSIRIMAEKFPEMLVGAGTVLTTEQVDRAVNAGAKFIVSPGLNPKVVAYCTSKNIPIVPGCAIRVHDGEKLPLEQLLPILRSRGFACGHIALSKSISEVSTAVSALTPGFAMYLKKLFAKNELDVAVLGCYLNLATPDESALRINQEKYMANIRFASLMGCGVVGTETGAPNKEYKYEPACHTEEALNTFIANLRPVVEYAEKMGVIVAIEPVWKHIVCNPKRARRVLDEITSPNLQIIFDPVNLLCYNNYNERKEIFAEAMELLGKDIAVVHIKDFVVKDNELVSVAAGHGEMDYIEIMKFIKKEKPFIHVSLENTVPENAEEARKLIQSIWEQV